MLLYCEPNLRQKRYLGFYMLREVTQWGKNIHEILILDERDKNASLTLAQDTLEFRLNITM